MLFNYPEYAGSLVPWIVIVCSISL